MFWPEMNSSLSGGTRGVRPPTLRRRPQIVQDYFHERLGFLHLRHVAAVVQDLSPGALDSLLVKSAGVDGNYSVIPPPD